VSTVVIAASIQKMQIHKIIIVVKSLIQGILVIIFLAVLILGHIFRFLGHILEIFRVLMHAYFMRF
jgi:hypothetical protein